MRSTTLSSRGNISSSFTRPTSTNAEIFVCFFSGIIFFKNWSSQKRQGPAPLLSINSGEFLYPISIYSTPARFKFHINLLQILLRNPSCLLILHLLLYNQQSSVLRHSFSYLLYFNK